MGGSVTDESIGHLLFSPSPPPPGFTVIGLAFLLHVQSSENISVDITFSLETLLYKQVLNMDTSLARNGFRGVRVWEEDRP